MTKKTTRLGYGLTLLGIVIGSALAHRYKEILDPSNVALFYVLLVVLMGTRFGRGPAIFCALLASLAFAFIFVEPGPAMVVNELQDIVTTVILLVVALLVGHLTATLEERATHAAALYELARDLAGKQTSAEVEAVTLKFFSDVLQARAPGFIAAAQFDAAAEAPDRPLDSATPSRHEINSLATDADAYRLVALPLKASAGVQGAVHFAVRSKRLESPRFRQLIETVASLVAVALERTYFAELARQSELESAAQNLRCSILASLSHDIRTPLTSLIGTADTLILARAMNSETQNSLLSGLREQAQSIHRLVVNLLEITRLQSGKLELDRAWQPIDEVLGVALKQAGEFTRHRLVDIDLQPGLPPLRIDAVLIERVLWNLIENACKYSPENGPLEIAASQHDGYVDVVIADRGPGLPPGQEETIFGLFERGNPESSIPGAGIGLAIARTIADAHEGKLFAENREGGGSRFHLLLPIGSPPCLTLED